jgi:hypothetical protein
VQWDSAKQNYIVPDVDEDAITLLIPLEEDTILLPEIEIFPYPTEELLEGGNSCDASAKPGRL